jgi:hypothetical protein
MKKIFAVLILIVIFSALWLVGCTKNGVKDALDANKSSLDNDAAEEDFICPLGIGNETPPGSCGLYRDANNDGYCDYKK